MVVIRWSRTSAIHSPRLTSVTDGKGTTVPPAVSVDQISHVVTSKAGLQVLATRSPASTGQYRAPVTSRTTARCGTTTPFGRPVEPDVYVT